MVYIITKERGDRVDLILIPKRVLINFLDNHVKRKRIKNGNTCLVTPAANWLSQPTTRRVLRLLQESIQNTRIEKGENRYAIPHHLFKDVLCRSFDARNRPLTSTYEGDFMINFVRMEGKTNAIAPIMEKQYGGFNFLEKHKLKSAFKNISPNSRLFVFVMTHLHPVKRR